MYNIIDLTNIKEYMKYDSTDKDDLFKLFQANITKIFERYTSKIGITRRINAEFHDGDGDNILICDKYPVYKLVQLYDDVERNFGSSALISSDYYYLNHKIGEIKLINSSFFEGAGNIKIDYWAGLSRFLVVDEQNNYLDITDTGGTVAIEIDPKTDQDYSGYSAEDVASAAQTALNANAILDGTYTVSYSHITQKFTIASDVTFSLLWNSGDNASKSIGTLLGFTVTADDSDTTSQTADKEATGIPGDIILACCIVADKLFTLSRKGDGVGILKRQRLSQDIELDYIIDNLPPDAKAIFDSYKRAYL